MGWTLGSLNLMSDPPDYSLAATHELARSYEGNSYELEARDISMKMYTLRGVRTSVPFDPAIHSGEGRTLVIGGTAVFLRVFHRGRGVRMVHVFG